MLRELADDGTGRGGYVEARDLSALVTAYEKAGDVRWVWASSAAVYPALLDAGVRVRRCHDVTLAEALLLGRDGRAGEAPSLAAAFARLRGVPVPSALLPAADRTATGRQEALFEPSDPALPDLRAQVDAVIAVHADQLRRIAADEHPGRFGLLVAAESAGGLAAEEMRAAGMPWRADVHDALLEQLLGPRPSAGMRPATLARLASKISAAFGGRPVNPDSPAQLLRAFAADGVRVPSTRSGVLREVDHPAVPVLLEYKELARLHAAHGWAWLDEWVSGGRFRPEYVAGGVVSGRWATRGGGALQIPRVLRRAVIADPGWVLVVADAAQLEPRVLAALADDRAFAEAAAAGDLYAALAGAFGGDRAKAKVALLSAMYGGAGGEAGQLLAVLRRRFPLAAQYVEAAARAGEEGRVVRSRLGRTCPPPSAAWRGLTAAPDDPEAGDQKAGRSLRARGRFTRNFVVQASAADWALVLLAGLRSRLAGLSVPESTGLSIPNGTSPALPPPGARRSESPPSPEAPARGGAVPGGAVPGGAVPGGVREVSVPDGTVRGRVPADSDTTGGDADTPRSAQRGTVGPGAVPGGVGASAERGVVRRGAVPGAVRASADASADASAEPGVVGRGAVPGGAAVGGAAVGGAAVGGAAVGGGAGRGPELVFFQHDEVVVHCPEAAAESVVAAIGESAREAGRLVFGDTRVRFPVSTAVVACYADAK
jgi:DNA polymerase family A